MSDTTEMTAPPRQRVRFAITAAVMLALWCWSLGPPIENWDNPNEDGLSYVSFLYATLLCLPAGIFLLVGALAGRGRHVRRARIAFFIAAVITFIVAAFLVIQHIANNNDGKVFGIQIGLQLDRHDSREIYRSSGLSAFFSASGSGTGLPLARST